MAQIRNKQTGAGRTDKICCSEHAVVQPDMITWSKEMGGEVQIVGLTIRKDMAQHINDYW